MTVYEPAIELFTATTEAEPSDPMVAVPASRTAEAPDDGAVKVTVPPATGSTGFFAVTMTASVSLYVSHRPSVRISAGRCVFESSR